MANAEQIRLWNEVNAPRWQRLRALMTRPLAPWGNAAMDALSPGREEHALDVGCGHGETTVELARRTGDALGIDVCEAFIETARAEATCGARYLLADAQTHRFAEEFDLLYSRFGVMFFEDPAAAFRNLRSALRPRGRMAVAVWGPWQENEWVTIPLEVLRRQMPVPQPSQGPGPFALADSGAFARLLAEAGFGEVSIARVERPFEVEAAQLADQGPAAAAMRTAGASEEVRARFIEGVAQALGGAVPRGVALIATAVNPGSGGGMG
ncbi:MAG: class I SAM-dependent methyltransferase [Deltaproteobacteria bacterium]